jgi:hypothetical protein
MLWKRELKNCEKYFLKQQNFSRTKQIFLVSVHFLTDLNAKNSFEVF